MSRVVAEFPKTLIPSLMFDFEYGKITVERVFCIPEILLCEPSNSAGFKSP